MDKDKHILVTGGTGFIGSYLIRYLVREGYRNIRALRRPDSSMVLVAPVADQVEWVYGDILDIVVLEEAMKGIDEVYHCAALISFRSKEIARMMQVNVDGTANVVNAALHEGVEKLLHVSSVETLGRKKNGETLDEQSIWLRGRYNTNYAISKFLGEQEVWRAMAEGLAVNIVNPAVVLGAGNWDEGPLRFFRLVWNDFRFYPAGASGFVDVRDVARFMIRLMSSEVSGQRFILSAENRSYRSLMTDIAELLGRRPPRYQLNSWIQELAWRMAQIPAWLGGPAPVITRETVQIASSSFYFDNTKSLSQFDFKYLPFENTLASACSQFLEASREQFPPKVMPLVEL